MTFKQWMKEVNHHLSISIGMTSEDIPDFPYRDMYEDEVSPEYVVEEVVSEIKRDIY